MAVPLVCLLLSCAVALSGAGVVLEGGLPILWGHTVASLTELPVTDGVSTPDPWDYLNRMSMYRILIAHTDNYLTSMGSEANQSPIWGLPLQLGWMLTSGRLADPTSATQCGVPSEDSLDMCISPSSWWACVNHFVAVLPFVSAAHKGFFGDGVAVQMQSPAGSEGFCTTHTTCSTAFPTAMEKWDAFFQGLKDAQTTEIPENEKKDALLGLYWSAQLESMHSSSACQDKLEASYSGVEKSFATSWLNAGEYVAAAYFQSSLTAAAEFLTPLPGRILKDGDSPPNIADLSDQENHSLYVFSWMTSANSLLGGTLVNSWRNAMCSVTARETGREMLGQLLFNPAYATTNFLSIVTGMASCS